MNHRAQRKQLRIWLGKLRLALLWVESRLAGFAGVRRWHHRRLARLVRATGLFDAAWYIGTNADVSSAGKDPCEHYVRHGDREGRQPMPLFDPAYYRAHAPPMRADSNSLLHYAWVGRYTKVSTSAWFDLEYYLRLNRDVARSGEDPLLHYLQRGGAEGRSPCLQFDSAFYLRSNPDVREARINPLIHYLTFGRTEGRPVSPFSTDEDAWHGQVYCPDPVPDDWGDIERPAAGEAPRIDIIVPVYKGLNETLRCLRSVLLSTNRIAYELIVINDASPEPELVESLEKHAALGHFTLVNNEHNLGFVATSNRGMMLHSERDIVLLNSDAEVYGDWLDRLHAAAFRDSRTGTVTPLSNNATIASYPRFIHDNPYPLEITFAELDALAAKVNKSGEVETPTGVGFCIYLRRDCLDETGLFDEQSFGRGYGEENDLCQRAKEKGRRNIIASDVFVHHLGSVSFMGERANRVASAMRKMDSLHPFYQRDVRRFIKSDPLAPARRNLDWARLSRYAQSENVLLVCHERGGGAERHLREETARLRSSGIGVFYLRPVKGTETKVRIGEPEDMHLPNLDDFDFSDTARLAAALRDLRITRIQVHGLVDFGTAAPKAFARLPQASGAALEMVVHDYQAICPRINLAGESGLYCGEPDEAGCDSCLTTQGNRYGLRSIRAWREVNAQLFAAADRLLVPNADVSERLARYFPQAVFHVSPHEQILPGELQMRNPVIKPQEPLHVVVVGAIGKVKGYDVLLECARNARQRALPLRFSVLGYSMDDQKLRQAGVSITGRYLEREGPAKLEALEPHVVWLPSLWPETYSYTLSMALNGGYPVFAFDIGAIGRRLRELAMDDNLMALETSRDIARIADTFVAFRDMKIGNVRGIAPGEVIVSAR